MKTQLVICAISACLATSVMADAPDYPDKSLGVMELKITSFTDWAAKLHEYTGKTVVLPEGVAAAMAKSPATDAMFGTPFFYVDRSGKKVSLPLRLSDFLKQFRMAMGLNLRYDAEKDAFVLNFAWETQDDRPNAELVKVLSEAKPVDLRPANRQASKPDPWRKAFDGLIGKPENRSIAWVVRWVGEKMQPWGDMAPVDNLFTGNVVDESGNTHFVILNNLLSNEFPGTDYMGYYIFDRNGKIEAGGVVNVGGTNMQPPPEEPFFVVNDAHTRLTYFGIEFKLEKTHLVLANKSAGQSADGSDRIGETEFVLDAADQPH